MKVVLQDGYKDCGVCCLLFIIRFYGGDVSKEYLREITNTTKDGVTLFNIIEAARLIGFEANGLSGKIEDIDVNNLPCIAHFNIKKNYRHFVVLYKIDFRKRLVTLMDPAKGWRTIPFSEYNLLSTNNYAFLCPRKKLPLLIKKNIIMKKIRLLTRNNSPLVISIVLLTIIYFIIIVLSSFHFKLILDYSINSKISYNLFIISTIVAGLYIFKNIANYLRNILLNKWNSIFTQELSTFTYNNILLLPYFYYKNRTVGEVLSRFKDLNVIVEFFTNLFTTFSVDILTFIIFLIIMFMINKTITLYINIVLLVLFIIYFLILRSKKNSIKNVKSNEDIINSYIIQGISNVDTIKGSHLEKRLIDKFYINYKVLQDSVYKLINISSLELFIKSIGVDLIYLILYGVGSYYVISNEIKLSTLIFFQGYISYYINSYFNIINVFSSYHNYQISLNRLEEIFMIDLESFKNNYFYLPYTLNGDIVFNKLDYKIGTNYIFKDLNLVIKSGERILLSGNSGIGKSTLMKMLLRYIEVGFGHISISDIDINHYHLQNIRTNITYVSANEFLFNDTVKNNIVLYKEYSEDEINNVSNICLVNDIVNDNLDYMIEENGFNLSSGERQRIILARAIIRKTNIYIFDEAFGQIDIEKEKKILNSIFEYLKGKTIIVISHRFNNKKLFDRVLKIEDGVVVEK